MPSSSESLPSAGGALSALVAGSCHIDGSEAPDPTSKCRKGLKDEGAGCEGALGGIEGTADERVRLGRFGNAGRIGVDDDSISSPAGVGDGLCSRSCLAFSVRRSLASPSSSSASKAPVSLSSRSSSSSSTSSSSSSRTRRRSSSSSSVVWLFESS